MRGWLIAGWRRHRLITIAVVLALVPRVLAELAFRPALLTPDSFGYLAEGIHPAPGAWHPAGYPHPGGLPVGAGSVVAA